MIYISGIFSFRVIFNWKLVWSPQDSVNLMNLIISSQSLSAMFKPNCTLLMIHRQPSNLAINLNEV